MTDEEAFDAFISRLQLHLQEHVGAHVQGDLQVAIAMAQCLEVYRDGDGAKTTGKGPKNLKIRKREMWRRSRELVWDDCPGGPGR